MISRTRRILLAVILAVSFVLLRLAYSFVFSGLKGKEVLLDTPEIRLSGPLRHITILGEVSIDGIFRNIQLSLPFATTILVFGILSSFITPKFFSRLTKSAKLFKKLITAIGIAFASIPSLLKAAGDMRSSVRLRRESKFSVVIPLLERAVVTAGEVGLALARSEPENPISRDLAIRNFQIDNLGPVNVTFQRGSIHVITGDTGSGKSTLLQFIAGLLSEHYGRRPVGSVSFGEFNFNDFAQASKRACLINQFPKLGILEDEVLIGGERKPTWQLSHGEAYRAAVEKEFSRDPSVILLDEPAGALDAKSLDELLSKCEDLVRLGKIVLIAEHRISSFSGVNASYWRIDEGRLLPGMKFATSFPTDRLVPVVGDEVSIEISASRIGFDKPLIQDVALSIKQGELIALTGDNGSGKTTLLNHLATTRTGVLVHGLAFKGPDPRRIALVPEQVSDFFVTASLEEELARADRIARVPAGFTKNTFESLLSIRPEVMSIHPLDLSIGTQLALATSMQLSHKPQLLLLDEPVQGLDSKARGQLAETIRCVQETGCAVVFATHDLHFAKTVANRVYEINARKLAPLSEVKT